MSAGTGKTMRMSRIFDANGNAVIFAPVHNSTSVDPFEGQLDVPAVVTEAARAGATAMNLTKGSIRDCAPTWIGGIGTLHYTFLLHPARPRPDPASRGRHGRRIASSRRRRSVHVRR